MTTLAAWIGIADLQAAESGAASDVGPIAQALAWRPFEEALLLSDHEPSRLERFLNWLRARAAARILVESVSLGSPTDFADIYRAASVAVEAYLRSRGGKADRFELEVASPTPAGVSFLALPDWAQGSHSTTKDAW